MQAVSLFYRLDIELLLSMHWPENCCADIGWSIVADAVNNEDQVSVTVDPEVTKKHTLLFVCKKTSR